MTDIVRPIFGTVWAESGEKLAPTEVKIQGGWIQEMMPYQYQNFLQNRVDNAVTYLLQKGVAEWESLQEYIANKSVVTYSGQLYMAITTNTGVTPTNTATWRRLTITLGDNGALPIAFGGTGATSASDARTNLGLGSAALLNADSVVIKSGTGNAPAADKLTTARTINLTGGASGSVSFDGSSNQNLNVTGLNASSLNTGTVPSSVLTNAVLKTSQTGSAIFPSGTTAERDASPSEGFSRWNRTSKLLETWNGASWVSSFATDLGALVGSGASQVPTNSMLGSAAYVSRDNFVEKTQNYTTLRAYTGAASMLFVTEDGISGIFATVSTGTDNGGTIIVGTDGRKWKRLDSDVWNVLWFQSPKNALDAAYAAGVKTLRFPAYGGNVYTFGLDTNPAASVGMLWDVEAGVTISVPDIGYFSSDLKVTRPTRVYLPPLQNEYWMTPYRDVSRAQEVSSAGQMSYSDADFSTVVSIRPDTQDLTYKYIPWSGSDTFTSFTPAATSSNGIVLGYPTTGAFSLGMRSTTPGDELTVRVESIAGTSQFIVALVRTTVGIHGIYSPLGASATPDFFEKLIGQTARTNSIVFPPLGTHQSYDGEFATWSIRTNTPTNFSILLSGIEVLNYSTTGEILEVGLGGLANASGQQLGIYDWTLTSNKADTGKKSISIAMFGDSRTDKSMPDTWPNWLRRYLDGWHGMRINRIKNYAVSGNTASQQAVLCTAGNIADVDVVIIDVGTNDIQAGTDGDTFYNTLLGMAQTCLTAGKKVIIGIPDQFYGQGQSGGIGQGTSRYGLGRAIRTKAMRVAADLGVKLVDKQQCLGPIMAQYVNPALADTLQPIGVDPIVFDNIHFTAFGQQLIGGAYARAVAGLLTKNRYDVIRKAPTDLSSSSIINGWSSLSSPVKWRRDDSGQVFLSGTIQAGTKTDGTIVISLPENIRPNETCRFSVVTDTGGTGLLNIDPAGNASIYYVPSGMSWLALDGVSFSTKWSQFSN